MDTFHIAEQRVNKINEPLLVIGLGGTGTDALLNIMDKFKRRFHLPVINGETQDAPARTAYLAVDTDATVLTQKRSGTSTLSVNNFFDLSLPGMAALLDPRKSRSLLQSYELEWIDQDLQSLNAAFGAGGVRQCGRFMLCKKTDSLLRKLRTIIQSLMAVNAGASGGESITVILLAGLGGGTGSGTFLDMAYLVRHVMEESFRGIKLTQMGFFVLPDVNISHAHFSDANQKVLRTNGFASLKELDFWMNYDSHHYRYVHKYADGVEVQWTQPFNDVVLLSEKNEDGDVIHNAYELVMDTISETLMHFMADERNRTSDGFTYQSHKVNVQNAMAHLKKTYPVTYCYMAIGAASTESQQNNMVVYEAKLTFDSLVSLQKNDNLLQTHFPETFHRAVVPDNEDPYQLFDAINPLPATFHCEPGFSFMEIRQMQGGSALHADAYTAYLRNARISVIPFAKERLESMWGRLRQQAIDTIKNPQRGPFRFEEYLKDPENGIIFRLEKWRSFWQNEADNLRSSVANERSFIDGTLYPAMIGVPLLERLLTERRARLYLQATEALYAHARNQIVATHMAEVFQTLVERTRNYANLNLTTFNRMVLSMRQSLDDEVTLLRNRPQTNEAQLITFDRLQSYVDEEFGKLKGGLNSTTEQVLEKLAEMSFGLEIDGTTNKVADLDAKQREFTKLVERFVNETFRTVNRVHLDGVLDMTMPAATEAERVNYIATILLPKLRNSARTMYQTHAAMRDVTNSYIDYSYVSVPYDADLMKKGLTKFRDSGEPITPKESEITDRLYWLKTYNCLPLCRFAMLSKLEEDYEESLTKPEVHGVHLVYNTQGETRRDRLRGTWKAMPSPVPHLLLGERLSPRQQEQLAKRTATMERAFSLGVVKLAESATPDGADIYLKHDEHGYLMEDETFCKLVVDVMDDQETSDQHKKQSLQKLLEGLVVRHMIYGNYVDEFAKTLNLTVKPTANTDSARAAAESDREKVRRYIAGYMIALQPELLEQIEGQLHMFDEYRRALDIIEGREKGFQRMLDYASRLALMIFLGMVRTGFGAFKFDRADSPDEVLFLHSQIKPEERGLPPVLSLLDALANEDGRVEPMKRRYLEDQATKKLSRLDRLTEEEQAAFLRRAREFVDSMEDKPEQMKYDEALTEEQRDKQSRLLRQMLSTARQYLNQ